MAEEIYRQGNNKKQLFICSHHAMPIAHVDMQVAVATWSLRTVPVRWASGTADDATTTIRQSKARLFPWMLRHRVALTTATLSSMPYVEDVIDSMPAVADSKWLKLVVVRRGESEPPEIVAESLILQLITAWVNEGRGPFEEFAQETRAVPRFSRTQITACATWLQMTAPRVFGETTTRPDPAVESQWRRQASLVERAIRQWTLFVARFALKFPSSSMSRRVDVSQEMRSESVQLDITFPESSAESIWTVVDAMTPSTSLSSSHLSIHYVVALPLVVKISRQWSVSMDVESLATTMRNFAPHCIYVGVAHDGATRQEHVLEFRFPPQEESPRLHMRTTIPGAWEADDVVKALFPTLRNLSLSTKALGVVGTLHFRQVLQHWDPWTFSDAMLNSPFQNLIRFLPSSPFRTTKAQFVFTDTLLQSLSTDNSMTTPQSPSTASIDGRIAWTDDDKTLMIEFRLPIQRTVLPLIVDLWVLLLDTYRRQAMHLVELYNRIWSKPLFGEARFSADVAAALTTGGGTPAPATDARPVLSIQEKKKMDLTLVYPTMFRKGHYKVQCQKNLQPKLISAEEAQALGADRAKHAMLFPPSALADVTPEWYACDKAGAYPYLGLKKNEGSPVPFLPCCFKTVQTAKNAVKLQAMATAVATTTAGRRQTQAGRGQSVVAPTDVRRDNRIHKDHIIKHTGQFGDLPPELLPLFLRTDAELDPVRVGIPQSVTSMLSAMDMWVNLEREPLRPALTPVDKLWKRCRDFLMAHPTIAKSAFPYETDAEILARWDVYKPSASAPLVALGSDWIPLIESVFGVYVLLLRREITTSEVSWSLGKAVRPVLHTMSASDRPVVIIYEHHGGRLDMMRERSLAATELVGARNVRRPAEGFHFQFSSDFLATWCVVNPQQFVNGSPMVVIPELFPKEWMLRIAASSSDALGSVQQLTFRMASIRSKATAFLETPIMDSALTQLDQDEHIHVIAPSDLPVWSTFWTGDDGDDNGDKSRWRWVEIQTAQELHKWILAKDVTVQGLQVRVRMSVLTLIPPGRAPWSSITKAKGVTVRRYESISAWPDAQDQIRARKALVALNLLKPEKITDKTARMLMHQRMAELLADVMTIACSVHAQTVHADDVTWRSETIPSLQRIDALIESFFKNQVSDTAPDRSASLDEWLTTPRYATLKASATRHGWRVDGKWIMPDARYTTRLRFYLKWFAMYHWDEFRRLRNTSLLPRYYRSFRDFLTSPNYRNLPPALIVGAHRAWRGHSYPLVTESLFHVFSSTPHAPILDQTTFFWLHPAESPWFPRVVLVQRCPVLSDKNIRQAYDSFASVNGIRKVKECTAGVEETKGGESADDALAERYDIREMRSSTAPPVHVESTEILVVRPVMDNAEEVDFGWIFIPWS